MNLIMLAVVVIAAIVLIVFAVMAILAIPFYVLKGEQYQEGRSYELKDIKEVKGTSDRDDEK